MKPEKRILPCVKRCLRTGGCLEKMEMPAGRIRGNEFLCPYVRMSGRKNT